MYPVSEMYGRAVWSGGQQTIVCDAWYNGSPLAGAQGLAVVGGSVTDSSSPGVRRQLDIELLPQPGLFDLLAPNGTQLRVRSVLRFPNGVTESVPMGVFDLDSSSVGYAANGSLTARGSDRWALIQRARFLLPFASTPTLSITDQIVQLIRGALGEAEPVIVRATSNSRVGSQVWERDRDKAIIDLADSIGAWVYFDRDGVATIDDLPQLHGEAPVWSVNLLEASRVRDRAKTYNVVVVTGEQVDGTDPFPTQYAWDNSPSSPTFAGPGSGVGPTPPSAVGTPFGSVPYFYSSPLLRTALQAQAAGRTILARVTGLNAQLSLSAVRNHALDALDTLQVLLPRERYDLPRPAEVHLADKITHPLAPSGVQQIETRATRTDEV